MLPEVREHLAALRTAYEEVERHRAAVALRAHTNGGDPKGSSWSQASEELNQELEWFEERSIQIKDVRRGLVDFPAVIEDREVLLCWLDGEPEVAWWHTPDDGFAGRQPL